jgi:threonine aldolase
MARSANAAAARLSDGLAARRDVTLVYPTEANMVFARLPRRLHRRLQEAGARYYLDTPDGAPGTGPDDAPIDARFVCDWATDAERVDAFLAALGPEAAPTAGYSQSCR